MHHELVHKPHALRKCARRGQVLARTPTAAPLLLPAVREELAVRALGRDAACLRLRGCLALGEAAGGGPLREGVLAAAVRCLLDLDVDIRWQDIAAVPGAAPTHASPGVGLPAQHHPRASGDGGWVQLGHAWRVRGTKRCRWSFRRGVFMGHKLLASLVIGWVVAC